MTLTFPPHPHFNYSREIEAIRAERENDPGRLPWVALIVSQAWKDEEAIEKFIDGIAAKYEGSTFIVADKPMGAAKDAVARAEGQGFKLIRVRNEYSNQAIQASHIIRLADIVIVFWAGGADLAKSVIDKALQTHRPQQTRFLPGLHVYEQTKTKATRSRKSQLTGRVRYRVRGAEGFSATLIERKAA